MNHKRKQEIINLLLLTNRNEVTDFDHHGSERKAIKMHCNKI